MKERWLAFWPFPPDVTLSLAFTLPLPPSTTQNVLSVTIRVMKKKNSSPLPTCHESAY